MALLPHISITVGNTNISIKFWQPHSVHSTSCSKSTLMFSIVNRKIAECQQKNETFGRDAFACVSGFYITFADAKPLRKRVDFENSSITNVIVFCREWTALKGCRSYDITRTHTHIYYQYTINNNFFLRWTPLCHKYFALNRFLFSRLLFVCLFLALLLFHYFCIFFIPSFSFVRSFARAISVSHFFWAANDNLYAN